jgi:hypothetical protein
MSDLGPTTERNNDTRWVNILLEKRSYTNGGPNFSLNTLGADRGQTLAALIQVVRKTESSTHSTHTNYEQTS